jgi:membrane associated rhomboid family serine protease
MGAYLMLFPLVRVRMLFIFGIFFRVIPIPAWVVLLWWLALQFLLGLPQLAGFGDLAGGVAVWAHIGGFLAGVGLIRWFRDPRLVTAREAILLQRGSLESH